LLLVLLTFSVVTVAAFAAPLLAATAEQRTQQLVLARNADLDRFATLAEHARATGDADQLISEARRYTELYGEGLVVADTSRRALVETGGMRAGSPVVARLMDQALRNEPAGQVEALRPWSDDDVIRYRAVGSGTRVTGAVVLRASVERATYDIARAWIVITAGALVALAGFGLLALVVSRWLLRPLAELGRGVRAVAAGSRREHVAGGAGPPELRELAELFNRMSEAVADADDQQRRLVADASHQLRNPMAALRLRVDALERRITPEGHGNYKSTVDEVERLEALLDRLLDLATADSLAPGPHESSTSDPRAVLTDRVHAWRDAAENAGLDLVEGDSGAPTAGPPSPMPRDELAQILDVVLDNAIKYAGSGATAKVTCLRDEQGWLITISDDGPGLAPDERALATHRFWRAGHHRNNRGTGLGLSIAAQLVASRGGRLGIDAVEPHGLSVSIRLPAVAEEGGKPH
jgi:signal transduction histidine kinase